MKFFVTVFFVILALAAAAPRPQDAETEIDEEEKDDYCYPFTFPFYSSFGVHGDEGAPQKEIPEIPVYLAMIPFP